MKAKHLAPAVAACVVIAGVAVWWAARTRPEPPLSAPNPGEPVTAAAPEPAPALELVGRIESLQSGTDGERSFSLRLARPDPPATESADAAYLRESIGVVYVRLRPAAVVTGAAPLGDGQFVRVRRVRSQPKPTYPPTWYPDSVRVVSAAGAG